jgi:transcriptional regulator of acetoin/glycerol metabolism
MNREEIQSFSPLEEKYPFERAEAEVLEKTLKKHQGNRIHTAQELGISRATLWRKIKRYKIK